MSYGLNAVFSSISHSNHAVPDPSDLQPPAYGEAPSTR